MGRDERHSHLALKRARWPWAHDEQLHTEMEWHRERHQ